MNTSLVLVKNAADAAASSNEFALKIRHFDGIEVDYELIALVSKSQAIRLAEIKEGPYYLFGRDNPLSTAYKADAVSAKPVATRFIEYGDTVWTSSSITQ